MEAEHRGIEVVFEQTIPFQADSTKIDEIVNTLTTYYSNVTGVVLFTEVHDTKGVLDAAAKFSKGGEFSWLASDGWGANRYIVRGNERIAVGAITVNAEFRHNVDFDAHLKTLATNIATNNLLSLIHISEPTRRYAISYAV